MTTTTAATSTSPKKYEASLDLKDVVAISVSAMLGSGIFVLPGLAAGITGPSVWLAYIVAGICVLPPALSKAELGTAMPSAGGTYVYIERTFGPLTGTVFGLGLWLSLLLKSAFALVGFGAYLEVVANVHLETTALVLLVLIVFVNILGVGKVSKIQAWIVGIATAVLLVFCAIGLFSFQAANLERSMRNGGAGFVEAIAFVFVSFAGVTKIAAIAEDVKQPERNLPLGILLSLFGVTLLYGFVVLILVGNLPVDSLAADLRPIHSLAQQLGGTPLGIVGALLGVVTMTSMANAGVLAASRFPFAMARDDLLPPLFKRLHARFLTPTSCIVATGVLMAAVILTLDVKSVAKLASAFVLMVYGMNSLSLIVLRETRVSWYSPSYRSPGYPFVQIFGIASSLYLLFYMGTSAIYALLAVGLPGVIVFFFYSRKKTDRLGVLGKLGKRADILQGTEAQGGVVWAKQADVVVTLMGQERAPETLVEMGAALADGADICVQRLTEIPDQTLPEALREDDARTRSLRRRIRAMANDRGLSLSFEALATRDVLKTIHSRAKRLKAKWLVMEWRARSRGSFLTTPPLGWLEQRLGCNIATFRDAGVRYIRKILVLVEPGPHDALVASTADHLAEIFKAKLTLARFVPDKTPLPMLQAHNDYLDELRALVDHSAECRVLQGNSSARTLLTESASYDLIVLGAAPEKRAFGMLLPSLQEKLSEKAECSVLCLRTPRIRSHDDAVVEKRIERGVDSFDLDSQLEERFFYAKVEIDKKESAFERFARVFAEALDVPAKDVVAALWERERTQNTSVGEGIAMPHATLAESDRLHVGVFTAQEGIEYEAIDGKPVNVFFVTIGPPHDRQTHLRVLGALSQRVLQTDLLDRLRAAEDAGGILQAFAKATLRAETKA